MIEVAVAIRQFVLKQDQPGTKQRVKDEKMQ
jgi:hypothetical protein